MKSFLLLVLAFSFHSLAKAQTAYIQVNGESGLSIYLDNQFKGKTTAELGGYIIENVKPGSHLIKVVKDNYTPFEETISVKAGEVFSYKVKPFQKHAVTISEKGNAGETEKTAAVRTGKLIVQSVPIEVKITIPQIEGVNNMTKTKDQWMANDIPAGSYTITFKFNDKVITKNVTITGDHETSVFVNMLNGSFTANTEASAELKKSVAKEDALVYVATLVERYKFEKDLTLSQFIDRCPEASRLLAYREPTEEAYSFPYKTLRKKEGLIPGYTRIRVEHSRNFTNYGKVSGVDYTFVLTKDYGVAKASYDKIMNEFKENAKGYSWEENYAPSQLLSYQVTPALTGSGYKVSMQPDSEGWYAVVLTMFAHGKFIKK